MNNFLFGDAHRQYYETICGGTGAGPGFHGTSAIHSHMTNTTVNANPNRNVTLDAATKQITAKTPEPC